MRKSLNFAAFICAVLVIASATLQGQSDRSLRLAALTSDIAERTVHGRFADASFTTAAKSRFLLMSQLAKTDPRSVLDNALPNDALAKIPAKSKHYFETRETLSGELEVIAECEENDGRIRRSLKKGDSNVSLNFADDPNDDLLTGAQVTTSGVLIGDQMALEANGMTSSAIKTATETTASALPGTTGEKRVLVILVNFQDNSAQPYSTAHAQDVVFNQGSNFFRENSYGQTWLSGDVYGWYTIPLSSVSCDTNAIGSYARQAAASAGVNLAAYDHYVYGFPSTSTCGFSGRSSVGGTPSHLWVNSNLMGLQVFGHEFGHSLGLYHSRSLDCGSEVIGTACTSNEYGDTFDIMGISKSIHMNSYQKERLGWLNAPGAPSLQAVSSSGSYFLEPYSAAGSGVKGLKILKSTNPTTGARTFYYLEFRSPVGYDSSLEMYGVQNGVVVRTGDESYGAETYLLDMTPATTSWYDSYLSRGNTYVDAATGLSFTVASTDAGGAVVDVSMAAQTACSRSNPAVSLSPGQTNWLTSGSNFGYTATVSNTNSGGCPTESFTLSTGIPAGWGVSGAGALSIAPGSSATTVIYVNSPVGNPDGTYPIAVAASNGSYTGSASASYSIVSGISTAAVPGAPKYSRSQIATVTSTVTAGGSPVSGATVTFTMVKASGAKVTQAVVSGSDGRAVFTYRFDRKRDPIGTYSVNASAVFNAYSAQATTSFSVTK